MAQYTIKELEHLSGIKAHTIRVWEQRYCILKPKRTETNIRYYDDADLKSLLNISRLNERGYKISKIAQMGQEQILEKVQQLCDQPCECAHHVSALVTAMVDMDEYKFDRALSTATIQMGFQETMQEVVYPFLNKIGILWQTGNITPAHEHFVSNLIRQKLLVAIDGQTARWKEDAPAYILYLPENELHELGLLYMNYILRANNQRVIYMGQHLPFKDLELTYEQVKAKYICTVLTSTPEREQVQAYIDKLSKRFSDCTLYVYGYQVQYDFLEFPPNVQRFKCMKEFIAKFS
ncbi:MerR family transcriptional regulator [Pontibacter korlensis]|uniref:MerR family transcriptional regulator n=1 Tax=Pontibacter korlensis TaxID=400092 RepID=A0A0E3ZIA6_9BACT|nr:MerR family transcriptional regulator [Pontibacter korlensis]AKD05274.1 MerR family transcriptional regulator [Pontibacter korlensis]